MKFKDRVVVVFQVLPGLRQQLQPKKNDIPVPVMMRLPTRVMKKTWKNTEKESTSEHF